MVCGEDFPSERGVNERVNVYRKIFHLFLKISHPNYLIMKVLEICFFNRFALLISRQRDSVNMNSFETVVVLARASAEDCVSTSC